jgi:hypothetical protein
MSMEERAKLVVGPKRRPHSSWGKYIQEFVLPSLGSFKCETVK